MSALLSDLPLVGLAMRIAGSASVVLLLIGGGCSRSPSLVRESIALDSHPTVVRFEQPVRVAGPEWEMCFDFIRPGDSHEAGRINAVLIGSGGERYRLTETELDRRGEAVVCQLGSLTGMKPTEENGPIESVVFEAAELTAHAPMRLRGLRGGGRP